MALAAAIALGGVVLYPAAHASDIVAEYGDWTVSGKTGTVMVPGSYFPVGDVDSNARVFRVFSGKSTYLNSSTPPGQEFGSSQGHDYLQFGAASTTQPSKTTITFATPAPAGWGFVLGDIDAEKTTITATGANGGDLPAADLGWKGAFNYCENTPRPGTCTNPPFDDKPVWDEATATLTGHGPDTSGASGWFMPTKPVKRLTIKYSVITGIPVAQLWLAAKWQKQKPDIVIDKTASPVHVLPGGIVHFKITVTNQGDAPEPLASFRDDMSDVIDDAHYLNDAHADGGTVSYSAPELSWSGPVPPHETRTITYSVRIDEHLRGNGRIRNVVIAEGHRTTCEDKGCGVNVHIAVTVPCRAAVSADQGTAKAVTRYGC
ncbi:MAG TPA: hypothetical protein VGG16_17420 [Streptosporangiaceae bacterium]